LVASPYVLKTSAAAQTLRIRRDVQSLGATDPFFQKYAEAVQKMHNLPANDQRNWRNQALIHLNFCPHSRTNTAADFFHWHRHYITNFELICGAMIGDQSFALPYWNWTANRGKIPDPLYDLNFLNVQSWNDVSNAQSNHWGPARVTTIGTRSLAKGRGLQDDLSFGNSFTPSKIDEIKRLSDFNLFTQRLEGSPHNNAHRISGGTSGHMGNGMSPLDPIFWLHHCNIDCLWAQWVGVGNNTTPPLNLTYNNQFVDATGQAVNATSASALNFTALGYTYDILSGPIVATLEQTTRGLEQTILKETEVAAPPVTLGADRSPKAVRTMVEARFTVAVKELLPNLLKNRTYWATDVPGVKRLASEPNRILARLLNVSAPDSGAPIIVNVYVDCPYLSPETPSYDPHYAGSFSFFGANGPSHDHRDFLIDVTDPVRALSGQGKALNEQLNIQLMALSVDRSVGSDATIMVEGVEIFRA
jgi:tyrosinase